MSTDTDVAAPAFLALLEISSAAWRPRAIAACLRLGIPDLLEAGPRPVAELAATAGAREDNLHRLLRALARDGLFEEKPPRTFGLTRLSRPLLSAAPDSVRNILLWLSSPWLSRLWDKLEDAVRTDESAFRALHGTGLYEYLTAHPEDGAVFHGAMTEYARLNSDVLASFLDFSRFGTVVDLGGGTGEQIAAILARYPGLRGINFDAVEVEAQARETLARRGVAGRCEVRSGDLRGELPRGEGAYLLKNILHDLSDADSTALLARCRAAMRPGGAVIVVQNVVPETEGPYLQFLDLQLLLTGAGGKERTRAEFERLFSAAGLRLTQVVDTPAFMSLLVGEV
jgi:predicted O-methyltransferase YrrM